MHTLRRVKSSQGNVTRGTHTIKGKQTLFTSHSTRRQCQHSSARLFGIRPPRHSIRASNIGRAPCHYFNSSSFNLLLKGNTRVWVIYSHPSILPRVFQFSLLPFYVFLCYCLSILPSFALPCFIKFSSCIHSDFQCFFFIFVFIWFKCFLFISAFFVVP